MFKNTDSRCLPVCRNERTACHNPGLGAATANWHAMASFSRGSIAPAPPGMQSALSVTECVEQVTQGEERETADGAGQIQVVARAALGSPSHRRKQVQAFANVGQRDHDQPGCAQDLKQGGKSSCSSKQPYGPK